MLRRERISAARRTSSARGPLLWLLAGLLESPWLGLLALGASPWPVGWLLGAHLLATLLLFFVPPRGPGYLSARRPWRELSLWALLLPGLGWLAAGAFWLTQAFFPGGAGPQEDEAIPSEEEAGEGRLVGETAEESSRKLREAVDVLPVADALMAQDPELKRGAIEALAKIRTPEAIEWLLKARRDPIAELRFYATSALTNLKTEYEHTLRAAEKEALEHPGRAQAQTAFAQLQLEFALSGLLDKDSSRELLARCRGWLSRLADSDEGALRLLYRVERELEPEKALARLSELLERWPAERVLWLKERVLLLFELRRYPELLAAMDGLRPELVSAEASGREEREWQTAALWWSRE